MSSNLWMLFVLLGTIFLLNAATTFCFNSEPNSIDKAKFRGLSIPQRFRRFAPENRHLLHVLPPPPIRIRPTEPIGARYQGPIKRGGPPYVVLQPLTINKRPRASRRLVLTLPKDNIQILNAEAMPERGSQFYPTTFTLSLRENDSDENNGKESSRYGTTRSYASQIPSPPRQSSRFHYGFVPMTQSDSEEDRGGRKHGRWSKGEVTYELDDLVRSSGGHVTVIKAHAAPQPKLLSARKVMGGSSVKAMKAIIIEPKEIEAKRVRFVETNTEKVSPAKARLVKAGEPMIIHGMKAKAHPAAIKHATITKSKGQDWAASNVHYVKAEPPQDATGRHQEEDMPPMSELQCGGTNDLGWCDLGDNYPSSEVSQIMEVCEELVSRMYVEVPENSGVMEDIASYSLSRNITENGPRPYWPWKDHVSHFRKPLCDVERDLIKPSFAQDIRGKWHVIIQTENFPQRISLEVCSKPGEPCAGSEHCSTSLTQCVQKYSHHQLISFDPESAETCPYVRLYKFPTSCVCRTEN